MKLPADITTGENPEDALSTVVALRRLADQIERAAVRDALRAGWSWAQIAQSLGVSRQAAHKRLSAIASLSEPDKD